MVRILHPYLDTSPIDQEAVDFIDSNSPFFVSSDSFWDQYFRFQKIAKAVAERDGRVSVQVVNNSTGEQFQFDNIVLKSSGEKPGN